MRGDYRKVTVTLPPEVYDLLIQESARRKSAGDPNHMLSAIAREWLAQRQPILAIERAELALYRAVESMIDAGADYYWLDSIHTLQQQVGNIDPKTLVALLVDITQRGWLQIEKYSAQSGKYLALQHWLDVSDFFYQGKDVRIRITIPGTRRKQALEAKEIAS